MIKNLIAAAMASILITQPPQNTNDGTYYQDVNITETYEYETNEVNSVDDLIVGNIYTLTIEEQPQELSDYLQSYFIRIKSNNNFYFYFNNQYIMQLRYRTNGNMALIQIDNDYQYLSIVEYPPIDITYPLQVNFTYHNNHYLNNYINYISASDYLGEKTVTIEPVETEGLYNLAYHFLYSRIYTNTELQAMETTLFGTTINMNMWLSHTTAIVVICLLLIVLIKFVLWLFKIVSGAMLWK